MPIYEYACQGCGEEFEALIRGQESASCPSCASDDVDRLLSLPAVHSEGTRDQALRAAQQRDAERAKDRMHERLKYEESHDRHG